jgi:prophage DNA circulation protein
MTRISALLVSLAIGVAAIFGIFAVTRTVSLGNQTRSASDAQIATRIQQLARYEASVRKTLAQKPPALPPAVAVSTPTAQPIRVVYHRPPPIVIHKHRAGGEASHETVDGASERGGADD